MTNVLTAAAGSAPEYSAVFVVLMGLGTVLFGLVCLVFICWLMGLLVRSIGPKEAVRTTPDPATGTGDPAAPAAAAEAAAPAMRVAPCRIPNRGGFVAAVSAAIAEELGTDVSKLRIVSIGREITPGATPAIIPNRGEFVAAVSAAIAEELGTDLSKLRIVSICEV